MTGRAAALVALPLVLLLAACAAPDAAPSASAPPTPDASATATAQPSAAQRPTVPGVDERVDDATAAAWWLGFSPSLAEVPGWERSSARAAWVREGELLGVLWSGSGSCVADGPSAAVEGGEVVVRFAETVDPDATCTDDLALHGWIVAVDGRVEPGATVVLDRPGADAAPARTTLAAGTLPFSAPAAVDGTGAWPFAAAHLLDRVFPEPRILAARVDDREVRVLLSGVSGARCNPPLESVAIADGTATLRFSDEPGTGDCAAMPGAWGWAIETDGAPVDRVVAIGWERREPEGVAEAAVAEEPLPILVEG